MGLYSYFLAFDKRSFEKAIKYVEDNCFFNLDQTFLTGSRYTNGI